MLYDVEFLRAYVSGRSVAVAHRVGVAQVAMEVPAMAGAAFLLPRLVHGYGWVTEELKEIRQRLVALEHKVDALGR